jgi:ABC-type amino acid transport system permease subunit
MRYLTLSDKLYAILIKGSPWKTILGGLWVTIRISAFALLLGTVLGGDHVPAAHPEEPADPGRRFGVHRRAWPPAPTPGRRCSPVASSSALPSTFERP